MMQQLLCCGLTFTFSGVVGTSIATDSLFGVGDRVTSKVNIGALQKGYVNIAVHGHLPLLVSEIVKVGQDEKFIELAKSKGAKGIRFYGICCSGLAAMYRYGGVIPLSNAVSAELVLGTGALDLWVADVQDVFPAIMEVAKCFQTTVVTTSESGRLPGAERYEYDHHHSNIAETRELAEAVKSGQILGLVNLVGCSNPKVLYEKAVIDVADVLLKNNVLILTNGCASFPLMKLGYCSIDGISKAGESLREFLTPDLPPVWHVGECIDNTRSSGIFAGIAGSLGKNIYEMPFAFSSPEWGNEKGIDAALGFRLMGVKSYHCVEAQIHGSKNVIEFLKEGTRELLGSTMTVDVDPTALGNKIVEDLKAKRKAVALGHRDGNVIVVSENIDKIEDLQGKTFAIPHRQSSHNILINEALEKAGLNIDDLTITELAPAEMPAALASGQIDGYCVAEPFGAIAVSLNAGKVLYSSEELWQDSLCCGLVLTDDFLNNRRETAREFVDAYKAAGNHLTAEQAKEIGKEYLNQDEEVLDISLQWISYQDLTISEEIYDSLVEKVEKYGLSENPPAYEDFVDNLQD